MIYRDDDLPQGIDVNLLDSIHQEFIKRDKIHTIAVLASEIDLHQEFVRYINDHSNFDIALHGWKHEHYPIFSEEELRDHLNKSMLAMDRSFGKKPTTWYLPWNGWIKEFGTSKVDWLRPIAKEFGLEINIECAHIGVVVDEGVKSEVVYFHWWHKPDLDKLTKLLDMEAK